MLLGHRRSAYDDLVEGLRTGQVHEVTVVGDLPDGATGVAEATLVWKQGWLTHEAQVSHFSGQAKPDSTGSRTPTISGDVTTALRRLDPDVRVERQDHRLPTGEIRGWIIPMPFTVLSMFLLVLTLGLLQGGPEPRFATRWGWGWLIFSPFFPFAAPAYLLLGPGRHPDDARRRRSRRLTGAWSFLVVIIFFGRFDLSGPS